VWCGREVDVPETIARHSSVAFAQLNFADSDMRQALSASAKSKRSCISLFLFTGSTAVTLLPSPIRPIWVSRWIQQEQTSAGGFGQANARFCS
jgi:hypothetical protein